MPRKQKKYHYIYKTTNLVNGKYYIGMHSTDNLQDGYIGSGKRLWYSINIYGKQNFKCEILEMLPDRGSLKEREKELVNEDILKDRMCMNLKTGGDGGFVNEEHKKKFFKASKKVRLHSLKKGNETVKNKWETDKKWSDNVRKKISEKTKGNKSFTGKKHKEESKKKIGESNSIKQKGENNSQFGTCWITDGKKNKKIIKTDLHLYPEWKLGRVIKIGVSHSGNCGAL